MSRSKIGAALTTMQSAAMRRSGAISAVDEDPQATNRDNADERRDRGTRQQISRSLNGAPAGYLL